MADTLNVEFRGINMSDGYNGLLFDRIIDVCSKWIGGESFVSLQHLYPPTKCINIDAAIYKRTEQGHLGSGPAHSHPGAGVFTPWTSSRLSING